MSNQYNMYIKITYSGISLPGTNSILIIIITKYLTFKPFIEEFFLLNQIVIAFEEINLIKILIEA